MKHSWLAFYHSGSFADTVVLNLWMIFFWTAVFTISDPETVWGC